MLRSMFWMSTKKEKRLKKRKDCYSAGILERGMTTMDVFLFSTTVATPLMFPYTGVLWQ